MIWRLYRVAEEHMQGWPDELLTISLVLVAIIALGVAIKGSAVLKAGAVAWFVLP